MKHLIQQQQAKQSKLAAAAAAATNQSMQSFIDFARKLVFFVLFRGLKH